MPPPLEQDPPCESCKGKGFIVVDDLHSMLCHCAGWKLMRQRLGIEIARAQKIRSSPLFVRGEKPGDPPVTDRTKDNLFLKGRWSDLIQHFRFAFICKGLLFCHQIVTDERIKNVFVGNERATLKSKEDRENTKSYNSLSDLVVDADLLIVKLGYLGHKNIAMAGALKEALMLREVALKPTWVYDNPDNEFGPGHHAYSEDVSDYIFSHFEVLDFKRTISGDEPEVVAPVRAARPVVEETIEERAQPSVEEPGELAAFQRELEQKEHKPKKFKNKRCGGHG